MFITHEIVIGKTFPHYMLTEPKQNPTHFINREVADEVEAKLAAEDYLTERITEQETLMLDAPWQVDERNFEGTAYWVVTLWVDTPGGCPLYMMQ